MDSFNARLYMVDISGYTDFLTRTSLGHANEVIAEILERLNESTGDDLFLNKVEGDALFFYTTERSLEYLVELSRTLRETFFGIVSELEEEHSNCPFKLCHNLDELSIKFLIHEGEVSKHEIGGFCELIGECVVEIHRMAKNDLEEESYIMVVGVEGSDSCSYRSIGEIQYDMIHFSE